jgi:uncharacterized membrane protein
MSIKSLSPTPGAFLQGKDGALSWPRIIFALLLILFVSLRFWHINRYSLWGGEAFTMIGSVKSWSDMFAYIVADIVHPPLIYILLKLWLAAGDSTLWLKLLPVLSGTAVIIPFYLLARELDFQLPEINLALLMLAVNGYLVHYAQELRMYSLFMFLAACSYWLFIRWFKTEGRANGQLLLLTLVNLLAIYTHYYGWVVVGMEFLFLLLWRRQKAAAFTLSMVFLALSFAPWAYLVVREALSIGGLEQNLDWIPKPGATDILNLYATFNGPLGNRYIKLFGLALFGAPLLFWGWRLARAGFRERRNDWIRFSWLGSLAFAPVLALFVVSQYMDQAVWIDRYFIFIAIPYMMLAATAVYQLNPRWLRYGWITAVVAWSLLAGFNDLRTNRMAWEGAQLGSRVVWEEMIEQMFVADADKLTAADSADLVTIYTLTVISKGLRVGDWNVYASINYYFDQRDVTRFQTTPARDVYTVLERAQEDYFWITFFDLEEWPQASPTAVLRDNGFLVGEEIVFQNANNRVVFAPVWRP